MKIDVYTLQCLCTATSDS